MDKYFVNIKFLTNLLKTRYASITDWIGCGIELCNTWIVSKRIFYHSSAKTMSCSFNHDVWGYYLFQ